MRGAELLRPDVGEPVDAELEAVIRVARQRARKRRAKLAAVVAGLAAILAAGGIAVFSGSAEESGPDRERLIDAGERLIESPVGVSLTSEADSRYTYAGLIDVGAGQLDVAYISGSRLTRPIRRPTRVVAIQNGRRVQPFLPLDARPFSDLGVDARDCWLDPPEPVGSYLGAVSVAESARLTAAITERLAAGTFKVLGLSAGSAAVEFPPLNGQAAQRPRWGGAGLLRLIEGPVEIRLEGNRVGGMRLALGGYQYQGLGPDGRGAVESVQASVAVEFAPTGKRLALQKPDCIGFV